MKENFLSVQRKFSLSSLNYSTGTGFGGKFFDIFSEFICQVSSDILKNFTSYTLYPIVGFIDLHYFLVMKGEVQLST